MQWRLVSNPFRAGGEALDPERPSAHRYHTSVSNPFRAGGEALDSLDSPLHVVVLMFQTPSERAVRRWRYYSDQAEYERINVSNPFRAGGEALSRIRKDQ